MEGEDAHTCGSDADAIDGRLHVIVVGSWEQHQVYVSLFRDICPAEKSLILKFKM
jgi:hypothetical protein